MSVILYLLLLPKNTTGAALKNLEEVHEAMSKYCKKLTTKDEDVSFINEPDAIIIVFT